MYVRVCWCVELDQRERSVIGSTHEVQHYKEQDHVTHNILREGPLGTALLCLIRELHTKGHCCEEGRSMKRRDA
jgi:hypothetical protein